MKNLISLASSLSVVVLLAACGGGDDGPAAATSTTTTSTTTTTTPTTTTTTTTTTPAPGDASRYVGTWSSCNSTGASTSRRETIVITATGASTLAFTFTETNFSAAACTGSAGTPSVGTTGTVAFTGTTKTVGTSTVDKGSVTEGTRVQKQIFLVTATTLVTGKTAGDGGTVDADGYPNTLESGGLTKQ